jgi:hypothetical protein
VRSRHHRPAVALVVAASAAALLAACSDDAAPSGTAAPTASASTGSTPTSGGATTPGPTSTLPTVAEVFRTARTSALSAESGHVVGSTTHDDKTLRIDVEGTADGSNQTVFITTPDGGTSEVVVVGNDYWLGGDEAFWAEQTGDPKAGAAMVGKYVQISESDATENGSYTLRGILTSLLTLPEVAAFEGDTSPVQEGEVDGRPAFVLGHEGGARLWVATDGSGTVLRAVGPPSAPADLEFSDWNRAGTFTPPPASKVVEG